MTRTEAVAYLRAERIHLDEQLRCLYSEFEALRKAHFPRQEVAEHRQRMQAYRNLVANHFIALDWTFHPPCGRTDGSSPFVFSAPTQPPCALALAPQDKAADLAVA